MRYGRNFEQWRAMPHDTRRGWSYDRDFGRHWGGWGQERSFGYHGAGGYGTDFMQRGNAGYTGPMGYGADYANRGGWGHEHNRGWNGERGTWQRGRRTGGGYAADAYQRIDREDAPRWTRPWRSSMPGGTVVDMSLPYGMGRGRWL